MSVTNGEVGVPDQPLLFEVSWEAANKGVFSLIPYPFSTVPKLILVLLLGPPFLVGGIYTVLRSKVPVTINEYGDR